MVDPKLARLAGESWKPSDDWPKPRTDHAFPPHGHARLPTRSIPLGMKSSPPQPIMSLCVELASRFRLGGNLHLNFTVKGAEEPSTRLKPLLTRYRHSGSAGQWSPQVRRTAEFRRRQVIEQPRPETGAMLICSGRRCMLPQPKPSTEPVRPSHLTKAHANPRRFRLVQLAEHRLTVNACSLNRKQPPAKII